jgi:hypothetical protein
MVPVPYNHRGIAVEARRFTARLSGHPPHRCLSGIAVQMPRSTIQPHLFKFGTYPMEKQLKRQMCALRILLLNRLE